MQALFTRLVRAVRHLHAAYAMFALLMLVLTGRLWWGWHWSRQLAAQMEEFRQRGWPASVEEMKSEPVADAENAFTLQMRAAKAVRVDSPATSSMNPPDYPPFP